MKKTREPGTLSIRLCVIALAALTVFAMTSCGPLDDEIGTVTIEGTKVKGEFVTGNVLTATVSGTATDLAYEWKVGTETVSTTNSCTPERAGTYTVTVSSGELDPATASVQVKWEYIAYYGTYTSEIANLIENVTLTEKWFKLDDVTSVDDAAYLASIRDDYDKANISWEHLWCEIKSDWTKVASTGASLPAGFTCTAAYYMNVDVASVDGYRTYSGQAASNTRAKGVLFLFFGTSNGKDSLVRAILADEGTTSAAGLGFMGVTPNSGENRIYEFAF